MKIILASSSQSRRAVMAEAGYQFETMSPDIDEKAIRSENPRELPLLIARAKAAVMRERVTEPALVIVADQITMCGDELREKPISADEARRFLRSYAAGTPAETVTALVVFNSETGAEAEGVDEARVSFGPIPEDAIERYVATGDALNQCGAFAIEHPELSPYVTRIDGEPDSIRGLPLALVASLLEKVR